MRLASVVAREDVLLRIIGKTGPGWPRIRAVAHVTVVVSTIGEPSDEPSSRGEVWIGRLRLLARARTREVRVAQHSEAISIQGIAEFQRGKLFDSTQGEKRVVVVAGRFGRHS
eukprot:2335836-Pleurochrysis_carterae.AAC.1